MVFAFALGPELAVVVRKDVALGAGATLVKLETLPTRLVIIHSLKRYKWGEVKTGSRFLGGGAKFFETTDKSVFFTKAQSKQGLFGMPFKASPRQAVPGKLSFCIFK